MVVLAAQWDDARIKQLNPTVDLPHARFTVVHRTDGTGKNLVRWYGAGADRSFARYQLDLFFAAPSRSDACQC